MMNPWISRLEIFCHRVSGKILRPSEKQTDPQLAALIDACIISDDLPNLKKILLPQVSEKNWFLYNNVFLNALDTAMRYSAPHCMEWLLLTVPWKNSVYSLVHPAATYGQSLLVSKMIKHEPKTSLKVGALSYALQGGQHECAEMLMLALEEKPYSHLAIQPAMRSSSSLPPVASIQDGPYVLKDALSADRFDLAQRFIQWQMNNSTPDYLVSELENIISCRQVTPENLNEYFSLLDDWMGKNKDKFIKLMLQAIEFSPSEKIAPAMFARYEDLFSQYWDDVANKKVPAPLHHNHPHSAFDVLSAHPASVPLCSFLNKILSSSKSRRAPQEMSQKALIYVNLVARHVDMMPIIQDFLLTPYMGEHLQILLASNPSLFREAVETIRDRSHVAWENNLNSTPILKAWWSRHQIQEVIPECELSTPRRRKI